MGAFREAKGKEVYVTLAGAVTAPTETDLGPRDVECHVVQCRAKRHVFRSWYFAFGISDRRSSCRKPMQVTVQVRKKFKWLRVTSSSMCASCDAL